MAGCDLFEAFGLFAAFLRKELGRFPVETSMLQDGRRPEKGQVETSHPGPVRLFDS